MIWYEVHYSPTRGTWDVYKVTGNGQSYVLYKIFKTETGARNFGKKHWVRRWAES